MDKDLSLTSCDSPQSSFAGRCFFNDDILSRPAEYGLTPLQTKISQRERKQMTDEQINSSGATKSSARVIHAQVALRNALDSVYFAELLEKSDLSESPQIQAGGVSSSYAGGISSLSHHLKYSSTRGRLVASRSNGGASACTSNTTRASSLAPPEPYRLP